MGIFAQSAAQEQAGAAVRAAVRMLHDLDFCNASAGIVNVETGIGINTGKVSFILPLSNVADWI